MQLTSFPPIITAQAKVLVLGSMPGQRSLAQNQYYAHPQNQFWPLMSKLCGADPQLPYVERLTILKSAGIALWDVLRHCEREGSLDAKIVATTEVPNDFETLLAQYALIHTICFNGQKAERRFFRHVKPLLKTETLAHLELISLPSTSPANTRVSQTAKLNEWRIILRYLTSSH